MEANEELKQLFGPPRPCTKCNGKGKLRGKECWGCEGKGEFPPPDVLAICQEIKGRKGLRSRRPQSRRAYYVWRMARFHGGADVTLPVIAALELAGDPFERELNMIAEAVARRVYGTDLAAAHRWLGRYKDLSLKGLPPSAYEGGPVVLDGDKPEEELPELF